MRFIINDQVIIKVSRKCKEKASKMKDVTGCSDSPPVLLFFHMSNSLIICLIYFDSFVKDASMFLMLKKTIKETPKFLYLALKESDQLL